ncbi:MAG TPA: hypothetical protein VN579_04425 [Bryobacteraceae bacterium]|nr:hypothetical protein [Bryobacteraceae bacterium]
MVGKAHRCIPRGPVVTPMFSKKAEAVTRAVVRKTVEASERAAAKSIEPASPVMKGRGRPAGSAYPGRVPVLIKFDPEAVAWLDAEYVRRKQPSRVDLIRALVDEARGGLK